jgi:hypothetical protein
MRISCKIEKGKEGKEKKEKGTSNFLEMKENERRKRGHPTFWKCKENGTSNFLHRIGKGGGLDKEKVGRPPFSSALEDKRHRQE